VQAVELIMIFLFCPGCKDLSYQAVFDGLVWMREWFFFLRGDGTRINKKVVTNSLWTFAGFCNVLWIEWTEDRKGKENEKTRVTNSFGVLQSFGDQVGRE